jgi:hypothetical protein
MSEKIQKLKMKAIEITYKNVLIIAFPLLDNVYTLPEIVGMSSLVIPPGSIIRLVEEI